MQLTASVRAIFRSDRISCPGVRIQGSQVPAGVNVDHLNPVISSVYCITHSSALPVVFSVDYGESRDRTAQRENVHN